MGYLAQDIPPCIVASNPYRGACVEVAALLAKATGLDIRVHVLPQIRVAYELQQSGQHISVFGVAPYTPHEHLQLIAKAGDLPITLLPSATLDPALVNTSTYWQKRQVGIVRGGCAAQKQILPGIRPVEVVEATQALRMLQLGRVDGVCISASALAIEMGKPGMAWSQFGPPVMVSTLPLWLVGSPDLAADTTARLRAAGEKLYSSGEIGRILASYMPYVPKQLQLDKPEEKGAAKRR